MKEYIFMTGLQKDKSNLVFSCVRTDVKIWLQSLWQRYRKFPVKLEISVNFGTVLVHSTCCCSACMFMLQTLF